MNQQLTVGLVQMTSGRQPSENLARAEALIREAAIKGAELIATPETTTLMELDRKAALANTHAQENDPSLKSFCALAKELEKWLLIGSIPVKVSADRLANRSFLIDGHGTTVATYDKIHMFDVDLANGESFRESKLYRPGRQAVVADTPWGDLGLTVCYDLRFPGVYRDLAQAGARIISVPAAFTKQTGQAHWHILLRARAIETGCFVIAPAQCGVHETGRETFGHSLAVSPWGEVLADGGEAPGVTLARLDLTAVEKSRHAIPALSHARPFTSAAELQTRPV